MLSESCALLVGPRLIEPPLTLPSGLALRVPLRPRDRDGSSAELLQQGAAYGKGLQRLMTLFGGDILREPLGHRGERGMCKVALQQAPHPRQIGEIARLAVALPQPREDADDLGVALGGKHRADQYSRDMFPYAIRAIERLAPRACVYENVKGLLRQSFADYGS